MRTFDLLSTTSFHSKDAIIKNITNSPSSNEVLDDAKFRDVIAYAKKLIRKHFTYPLKELR